eukprot:COSAG02_NODE_5094_length_4637_cov_18.747907_3_plen_65_part_00
MSFLLPELCDFGDAARLPLLREPSRRTIPVFRAIVRVASLHAVVKLIVIECSVPRHSVAQFAAH